VCIKKTLIQEATRACWLGFREPLETVVATCASDVTPALKYLTECTDKSQLYAVGFISYEAAPAFDDAFIVQDAGEFPLLWFSLYKDYQCENLVPELPPKTFLPAPLDWNPSVTIEDYVSNIQRIKQYLARGDSYQVNYTYRLQAGCSDGTWELFLALVRAQQADYSAYIDTGRYVICSASPELFFSLRGTQIVSIPMKGTIGRGRTLAEDQAQAKELSESKKNQAENMMIVDMIRNDLARVSDPGSVSVSDLFAVRRYPTVWQMTSTVTASTDAPYHEIISALFPCASITGCPKARTMEIIAELETNPRHLYTGCIGYFGPHREAQFNVAIRTVVVDKQKHLAEYGVGGGIVWDSISADEYEECHTKMKVLTQPEPIFSLLETILWTPEEGYFLLSYHLRRLAESAEYFGIPLDLGKLNLAICQFGNTLAEGQHKVRLLVAQNGEPTLEAILLKDNHSPRQITAALADRPVHLSDKFLYHKTTCRDVYDQAHASYPNFDDVILWNEQDEITESCYANVVVELNGELLTPPVSCGLLAGTFRAQLLKQGAIREAVISKHILAQASQIYLINSVRKWQKASLDCLAKNL
jgi:para-aminobenzoate synthetase / 4-amino-4-deoxychorismate lyase